jgi:hypothetical protein
MQEKRRMQGMLISSTMYVLSYVQIPRTFWGRALGGRLYSFLARRNDRYHTTAG